MEGKLKHNRSGNKVIIYYPNLVELLINGDNPIASPPAPTGEVRQLNAN
jgi:hypothetical protein